MSVLIFAFLALLAEILGTVGGFGSSVFFVPLAGYFFDIKTVLGITAIFHVFSNLSKLVMFYKTIDWKLTLLFGIPSILFVILGAWLTTVVSFKYTEIILAVFLTLFSLLLLWKSDLKLPNTKPAGIISGSIAGFLAGFTGTGGAVRGLALSAYNLEKSLFVGTSAAIDMGVDFSRAIIYSESGYVNSENYVLILVLAVVSVAGSYIGKLLLQRISQQRFRNLVLAMIGIVGGATLVKSLYDFKM
ncbi:MAG TPA: sulfite exporter TauE/SafE family protein [Chitinophagales bacterium]|nr:sulfite exporter TauE/SafE family protein [Chitinophagales bacterium]